MTFDWQATLGHAIHNFGDTPGAQLEQHLRDTFEQHPQAVTNAISKIIDAHKSGHVRSPWGALRSELDKQVTRELIVDTADDPRKYVRSAEQWIRNAGKMYDRWPEALDELKRREKLQPLLNPATVERLYALWLEQRPIGERIETEELERAEKWKAARAKVTATIERDPATLRAKALALSQTPLPNDSIPSIAAPEGAA